MSDCVRAERRRVLPVPSNFDAARQGMAGDTAAIRRKRAEVKKHSFGRSGFFALLLFLSLTPAWGGDLQLPAPGPRDTCPVCGMFVALYPDWVATVRYQDGHAHHFDGAKDLFKYLLDLPKYAPGHSRDAIAAIGVTEYYGLTRIDARAAWYVIGSDMLGPMGHELAPLATRAEAEEFLRDHHGKRIVRFEEVTPSLLEQLDKGQFP